jgi:hypothetical protein
MLLDDTYHEWMHQPPELPPISSPGSPQLTDDGKRKPRQRSGKRRKR